MFSVTALTLGDKTGTSTTNPRRGGTSDLGDTMDLPCGPVNLTTQTMLIREAFIRARCSAFIKMIEEIIGWKEEDEGKKVRVIRRLPPEG